MSLPSHTHSEVSRSSGIVPSTANVSLKAFRSRTSAGCRSTTGPGARSSTKGSRTALTVRFRSGGRWDCVCRDRDPGPCGLVNRRLDEAVEERMRPIGSRAELRVELRGHEPWVVAQLDDLDQPTVG